MTKSLSRVFQKLIEDKTSWKDLPKNLFNSLNSVKLMQKNSFREISPLNFYENIINKDIIDNLVAAKIINRIDFYLFNDKKILNVSLLCKEEEIMLEGWRTDCFESKIQLEL